MDPGLKGLQRLIYKGRLKELNLCCLAEQQLMGEGWITDCRHLRGDATGPDHHIQGCSCRYSRQVREQHAPMQAWRPQLHQAALAQHRPSAPSPSSTLVCCAREWREFPACSSAPLAKDKRPQQPGLSRRWTKC